MGFHKDTGRKEGKKKPYNRIAGRATLDRSRHFLEHEFSETIVFFSFPILFI